MRKTLAKIQNPLYLMIWLGLSLIMGYHHEPFSDEAQSYLVARDVSLLDLIKDVARTEGHPLLWYCWLKLFILAGISYNYIYLTSIIPNFLGVWVFIKKAPFSAVARYLFPLTYFIFFQYNIVARNYSMLLLFISLTAIYYPKRKEYPWLYMTILMLLGQITAYTFIFACGVCLMGIYEDWKKKEIYYPNVIVYGIYALVTIWIMCPNANNQYFLLISQAPHIIIGLIRTISTGLITFAGYYLKDFISLIIGSVYFTVAMTEIFYISRKGIIFLLVPILIFSCFASKLWHGGIIILVMMFILWQQPQAKLSKLMKALIVALFVVQIVWSAKAFTKEINTKYSSSKDVYQFLAAHNISSQQILKLYFNTISICPYYNDKNCTYWDWKKYKFSNKEEEKYIKDYKVYIINQRRYMASPEKWDRWQQDLDYNLRIFPSAHFVATLNESVDETLYVYYRKSIHEE